MTDAVRAEPTAGSVVFLISSLNAGGAERQLIGLAAGLVGLGWRVRVVTFSSGGALAGDLLGRGVVVEGLGRRGWRDVLGFAIRLVRSVRRGRPDVIHSYLLGPNIASALLKPFARGARVVWGVRASDMNLARYGRRSSLLFALSSRLARFADAIICNSTAGLEHHAARGYPRDRMVMIPNGIDTRTFAPNRPDGQEVRAEWGVPDAAPLVGLVGRIDPMKDHETFLRAARVVADSRPDVRFACVGHGAPADRAALERRTAELGLTDVLMWAGGRSDLSAVHNGLDLLVSSSAWGEGFSNVVAEAMATGVPCVVTDVGDSAALVAATGWVCPPGQPAELAAAILAALADRQDLVRRGALARRRIVEEFSEERRDRATAQVLARHVARRATPER